MKRWLCCILTLSIAMTFISLPASASASEGVDLMLPDSLQIIEEEAFAGNTSISSVMIMNQVKEIRSRAFAGCSNLQNVYLGNTPNLIIADNAFEGCGRLAFYVYPDTEGEKYARSHGHVCNLITQGSPSWEKTMSLVAKAGKPSMVFQDGETGQDISTMRIIVRRTVNYLPDISDLNPVDIIAKYKTDSDTYIIQFSTVEDTRSAMRRLEADGCSAYVEADKWSELDLVTSSAIVGGEWTNPDPMGFETYVQYLSGNSAGQQIIAVVDSGIQIRSHYSSILLSQRGINTLEDYDGQTWQFDSINHGSSIASVIKNCVGNANVKILPVRVYGGSGDYDDALVAEGIDYAVDNGANIINLSFKLSRSGVVTDAINRATKKGCTVVVAAGNQNRNISNVFPANLSNVITVSGLSHDYELYVDSSDATIGSNFGAGIDYCAPYSYVKDLSSGSLRFGTSFSAPIIASAIALVNLDKYHSIADMQDSCALKTDKNSFGHGMPQLQKLSVIKPVSIQLNTELPDKMKIGDSIDLSWTIKPSNTTNKTVTASSSESSVLDFTQSSDGAITLKAVGQGTANFTLTVNDSTVSVSSKNIVVEQPVTSLTITGAPAKLIVGKTVQLSAMVSPSDATTKTYTWHSANNCASVDPVSGLVTGLSDGYAEIYATAEDGYGAKSNTLRFQVITQPDAESVSLYINNELVNDQTLQLKPDDIKTITFSILPSEAEQKVEFESTDNDVITVAQNGVITAKKSGTATIYAYASTGRNIRAKVNFKVLVLPDGITISCAGSTTINVGDQLQFNAVLSPNNVSDECKTITWTSSNPTVASVDGNGKVTAKSMGNTQIYATTSNGITSSAQTVTVRQPYTLAFNSVGGTEISSRTAYSGEAIGSLPVPTKDYYHFVGWFWTNPTTGQDESVNESRQFTSSTTITLFAKWEEKPLSGWVTEDKVPAGARIMQTSWSYREDTESTSSSVSGWTANGSYWNKTGTGSKQYASFPSTYDTSHATYKELNGSAYGAYENESAKRTVSNTHSGYVYWHWAYNVPYANRSDRWISDRKQVAGSSRQLKDYYYQYFYAFKSTTNAPAFNDGFSWTWGANAQYDSSKQTYNCANCLPSGADTSATSGLATPRFLRLDYYTSSYTDYQKIYKYYRNVSYSTTDPGNGSSISNKVKYVKYQEK